MALHKYRIECTGLSTEEIENVAEILDRTAFINSVILPPSGVFEAFYDERDPVEAIFATLPKCTITRLA